MESLVCSRVPSMLRTPASATCLLQAGQRRSVSVSSTMTPRWSSMISMSGPSPTSNWTLSRCATSGSVAANVSTRFSRCTKMIPA